MRLCVYVMTSDTGFAPNPYGGYCALAACTPNHQRIAAKPGDLFLGHSTVQSGQRMIHVMQMSEEKLSYDEYYRDPRFQKKKPEAGRGWRRACGNNVYHKDASGNWISDPLSYHNTPELIEQDLKYPYVFVSKAGHYYYFGEEAPLIPKQFHELLRKTLGCKCDYPVVLVHRFLEWLQGAYAPGIHGKPKNREPGSCKPYSQTMCKPVSSASSFASCSARMAQRLRG